MIDPFIEYLEILAKPVQNFHLINQKCTGKVPY